jgi:hypothetical protein
LIGVHSPSKTSKYLVLENPLIYQITSITNPFGIKIKDMLIFKPWFEFTDETTISFLNSSIISVAQANDQIVDFYRRELTHRAEQSTIQNSESNKKIKSEDPNSTSGIIGNFNFKMNFDTPEQLNIFMENIQMGMGGILDEIMDMDEDDDIDKEDDVSPPPKAPKAPKVPNKNSPNPSNSNKKKTNTKNKISKRSFDIPFDKKNTDPNNIQSWSENPEDYIK